MSLHRSPAFALVALLFLGCALPALAQTNAVTGTTTSDLPDLTTAALRVFGTLALVIALFLGGVWLVRNSQSLLHRHGPPRKLQILEARSLGHRQALYVVGYEDQRMLIASSPAGVQLVSHLPGAAPSQTAEPFHAELAQSLGATP